MFAVKLNAYKGKIIFVRLSIHSQYIVKSWMFFIRRLFIVCLHKTEGTTDKTEWTFQQWVYVNDLCGLHTINIEKHVVFIECFLFCKKLFFKSKFVYKQYSALLFKGYGNKKCLSVHLFVCVKV